MLRIYGYYVMIESLCQNSDYFTPPATSAKAKGNIGPPHAGTRMERGKKIRG